ncbi:Thioredoxin 1 [Candidatus Profftia lariciata]|uniref:thioredoxin TrxA n=1 Tax=Candidatus Profftia lariciata TaxID=1987921 RepID=UPI001D019791|nr:thioredoxin TrxA [Candidatus Profftia lariciata]UDG81744.1 Thioredoxin 1 [Candidatus Profftia lariciata]
MGDKIIYLSDTIFDSFVLKSKNAILVDFWAEWCGPCKMIAPILNEIAIQYGNKLIVCKLNIDNNPTTALKFNIRSIPTLLLFQNGVVIATKIGSISKKQLESFLNVNL